MRLLAIVLMLVGLGLGFVALIGAVMIAIPPVKPPEDVEPGCCLQYAPILFLIPIMVLYSFGFTSHSLWKSTYPAWQGGWHSKVLILLHGFSWLVSLVVLWIWIYGVLWI